MASLIKGVPVTLYDRSQTGTDAFNAPIFTETPVVIANVLISPVATTAIVGDVQMSGKRQEYELSIPKDDTHIWENRTVEFYGHKWQTIGFLQEFIPENVPLDWSKKIRVERYG